MSTLVELYKDRIYGSIFSMVQDKYAAEEIFREVLWWSSITSWPVQRRRRGNFLQWALNIAQNYVLNIPANKNGPGGGDEPRQPFNCGCPGLFCCTPDAEPAIMKAIINSRAWSSMLPDEQREVVRWNHYAGLSFEIAGIMKCSLTAGSTWCTLDLTTCKQMTEKEMLLR